MKREVSVLLASANINEELIPIGILETADMETLRKVVEHYLIVEYAFGDEQGYEINLWTNEIVESLYNDSEYKDKSGTELRMSLHSTLVY